MCISCEFRVFHLIIIEETRGLIRSELEVSDKTSDMKLEEIFVSMVSISSRNLE